MYTITKSELIFVLDTIEEVLEARSSEECEEELKESVTIINGILDYVPPEED